MREAICLTWKSALEVLPRTRTSVASEEGLDPQDKLTCYNRPNDFAEIKKSKKCKRKSIHFIQQIFINIIPSIVNAFNPAFFLRLGRSNIIKWKLSIKIKLITLCFKIFMICFLTIILIRKDILNISK